MWGEDVKTRKKDLVRHGIDDIDVAGGSGSGWAGEGNSLYCDQLTYILLLTRTREGGWQVEVQLQYSQLFCFCLLHVFIPLCSQHVTTLCLLHLPVRFCSRSVPSVLLSTLRFVHRSGSLTVVNRYFQFPVPSTATFPILFPAVTVRVGQISSDSVNSVVSSRSFLLLSLPVNCCSGPSVCVFVVLFMLCRGSRWLPQGLKSVRSVYLVLLLLNCVQWFSCAILIIVLIMPYRYIFTYFLFALKLRFSEPWYWTKK